MEGVQEPMCQWYPREFRRQWVLCCDAATSIIEAESVEHEAHVPSFNEALAKLSTL